MTRSTASPQPRMVNGVLVPTGAMFVSNGRYPDSVLEARADDNSVWLSLKGDSKDNPFCYWIQFGDDSRFMLYNLGKGMVMAYDGGNAQPLSMQPIAIPSPNAQNFSWGGWESWGARALQAFIDSGQNVDARGDKGPTTGALHTRGWRDGDQMELTWNLVAPPAS